MPVTTIVDANVLLDILTADAVWASWSVNEIHKARAAGSLVINQIICAEIAPAFDFDWNTMEIWLRPSGIVLESLPFGASAIAASAHRAYRERGGIKAAPMPDFYIGTHATFSGYHILTRDPSRYRTYFPTTPVRSPDMDAA